MRSWIVSKQVGEKENKGRAGTIQLDACIRKCSEGGGCRWWWWLHCTDPQMHLYVAKCAKPGKYLGMCTRARKQQVTEGDHYHARSPPRRGKKDKKKRRDKKTRLVYTRRRKALCTAAKFFLTDATAAARFTPFTFLYTLWLILLCGSLAAAACFINAFVRSPDPIRAYYCTLRTSFIS